MKELVKAVLNITQGIFFSLEKKYINNLESIINKKYSDIIDVFNKSHSKINSNIKHVFNKINTSEQIIKKKIDNEMQNSVRKIHNTQYNINHQLKTNIEKGNRNITQKINNVESILYFLKNVNDTTFKQKFTNITNNKNYIRELYFKDELSFKYILPFYIPFIFYLLYFCCKKYISRKNKKTILPLYNNKKIIQNKTVSTQTKLKIDVPKIKSNKLKPNKWKEKIKELESNINALMILNKNEKNNNVET